MAKAQTPETTDAKAKAPAKVAEKPAPSLSEQIRTAAVAREKAIAAGEPQARKAAKAAVEKFRTKANMVLVDEIEQDVKAGKAAKA